VKKGLLVLFVLLVGLLVVGDRAAEQVAESAISRQLEGELGTAPSVEVGGFPFLHQALRGRYDEITVEADRLRRDDVTVQDFRATLEGNRVSLSDVVGGSVDEVPVDRLQGTGLVTFAAIEEASGGQVQLEPAGDRVRVRGTVTAFGRTVEAAALAEPVVQGPDLLLRASEVTVAGEPVTGVVGLTLVDALSLGYPVPELPYGLQLREVDVTDTGVVVTGGASDVLLRR